LELVAVTQIRRFHPFAVDEGAVQAALVLEPPAFAVLREDGVLARDGDVVEEDRALGRTPDRRRSVLERERFPGAPAARADDEGRAVEDAEILERVEALGDLGSVERLGRLPLFWDDERGAALRAEVRGLRVVVPALRAVDVRRQAGGAALPVRISVSESTS